MDGRLGRLPLRLQITATFVVLMLLLPSGLDAACFALAQDNDFIAPVDGPIVRKFEQPLGPYAAGHRGVDFEVPSGSEVVASSSGTVKFAGPVADDGLFITIAHDAQLETTYSFLSRVDVAVGQKVPQGDAIGLSGSGHPGSAKPVLHFGAKVAGVYIDPEILLFGNLDDISGMIALAPLDESASGAPSTDGGGSRSSLLRPVEPISVKPAGSPGVFAIVGKKISGIGSAIARAPRAAGDWISRRAEDVGGFFSNVKEAGRTAIEAVGAAASRTKSFFTSVGESVGGFFSATKRLAERTSDRVSSFLTNAGNVLGKAGRWTGNALGKARSWLGRVVDLAKAKIGAFGSAMKRLGMFALRRLDLTLDTALFVFHVGKGAVQQIACSIKGGAPPPAIPTPAEMDAGMKPPKAPNDNIVVTIAGIGSQTEFEPNGSVTTNAAMYQTDLTALGFSEDQIYNFSYAGIQEGGEGAYRIHKPYSQQDTYKSIARSAEELARQIEEIHRREPGKEIDLIAHSQGGLVAQYYLEHFSDSDDRQRIEIDHFVSMGTPHLGADAAQLHEQLTGTPQGDFLLEGWDVIADTFGMPPPSSEAAREMSENSKFIRDLTVNWDSSLAKTTTIAATFDLVVTPQHSRLRGTQHYTADMPNGISSFWAHGKVVDAISTQEIVYNSLADTPSTCTALRNAIADHGVGRLVSEMQDTFFETYGLVVNGPR